jgi:hypothetical protein
MYREVYVVSGVHLVDLIVHGVQYHTRFRSGVACIYVCSAVYVTHYYRTPGNCMLPRSIDYPIVLEETS